MTFISRTLGSICDEVRGTIRTGPFGSQLHESDYQEVGIPVVMPKNIVDGKVSTEGIARIGDDNAHRLSQHRLQYGDIVYGRRGDIGRRALITEREEGWLCGTGCLRISLGSRILHPKFLYYYLGHPQVIAWITNQAIGATLPNLNTTIIRSIEINYPPLSTQHKIASILSAYDNLIENNTRRIAILEEMAQSIYHEWFVRFRYPGHEKDGMVESELGMIPEGCEVVKVSQAVDVDPHTKVPKDNENPFISMENLAINSMVIKNIGYRIGNHGSKFKNGDTLFARITPCIENGKTGYVQFLASKEEVAFGSTEFIVLRSRTLCPEFVYLMARSTELRNHAIKSMSGASGRQRVQKACFDNYSIAHPPSAILTNFSETISPLFRSIHILTQKNTNLHRTRDLLLPKLISGEIDVEALDIDIPDLIEPKAQQPEPTTARPEPIDATQLALPLS